MVVFKMSILDILLVSPFCGKKTYKLKVETPSNDGKDLNLLDLKNAFREVSHELLISVLRYHHLPDLIVKLVT